MSENGLSFRFVLLFKKGPPKHFVVFLTAVLREAVVGTQVRRGVRAEHLEMT